jgi:serine protease Do
VLAVGNPFGLGGTVSSGIISARGRDIHSGPYDDYLQLDAAINRGNSGGPTFNLNGQVIGINTAIYSPNGGSVGIGFAIPSSLARPVIEQLRQHGKVDRGWLGVQIQEVTPEIAQGLGLSKEGGALVADVTPGSPAAKAGFKQGDVILSFNGHDIIRVRDLPIVVAQTPVGDKAKVEISRDGKRDSLDVAIGPMPGNLGVAANNRGGDEAQPEADKTSALGLKLAPLTDELRKRAGVGKSVKGVVVTGIDDSSPLAELGIQPGDVIQQINQQPVTTPKQAEAKLKEAQAGKGQNLLLLINRRGTNQYLALSMSKGDNG